MTTSNPDPLDVLTVLAEAATPGPWRSWGMQLRASTCPERCADFAHSVVLADFYTDRQGHPRTFDLDLTIQAVNALPALIARVKRAETALRYLWMEADVEAELAKHDGGKVRDLFGGLADPMVEEIEEILALAALDASPADASAAQP